MTQNELYEALTALLPAQYDEVVFGVGAKPKFLPPSNVELSSRAIALIRWAQPVPARMQRLVEQLAIVQGTLMPKQPVPKVVFRWIHLSDIHFGAGRTSHRMDQQTVAAAILRDVEQYAPKGPDAIFVTGDIAFSAQPEQYGTASAWLTQIAQAAGATAERLRLVPGNHDVDRKLAGKPLTRAVHSAIRTAPPDLDEFLEDPAAREVLAHKLAAWCQFVSKVAPRHPVPAVDGVDWSEHLDAVPGLRGPVRIAGLSTVWVSDTNDGRQSPVSGESFVPNMVLGRSQLHRTFGDRAHETLLFVLTHHPPDWLHGDSATELANRLAPISHIHLCGHVHQAAAGLRRRFGTTGRAILYVAGASHSDPAEEKKHGYAWGAIRWNPARQGWEAGWAPRIFVGSRGEMRPDATNYELDNEYFAWEPIELRWPPL